MMFNKKFLSLLPISALAIAQDYPDNFSDFFVEDEQKILFMIAGDHQGGEFNATVSYDQLRISSEEELGHIAYFFRNKGLSHAAVVKISEDLKQGITTDARCFGNIQRCLIVSEGDDVNYVFDFDSGLVRLFVGPNLVGSESNDGYHDVITPSSAIINWSSLNGYSDLTEQSYLTWSNDTIVGLPLGHLLLDTQYSSNQESFTTYGATYNIDLQGHQFSVGRNRYTPTLNSTDFLNVGSQVSGEMATIGSSQNLAASKVENNTKIEFYAPNAALLEVFRDERLILSRSVSEGRQSINYNELPEGSYNIEFILRVGDDVILRDSRQIVNSRRFALPVGNVDYLLSIGQFDERFEDDKYEDFEKKFVRGLLSYRATEDFIIGGGITANDNDQYIQAGVGYQPVDVFRLDINLGWFTNADYYLNNRMTLWNVYFDYREFVTGESNFSLSNQLFSTRSYRDYSIGISGSLFDLPGYLRYSVNESDKDLGEYDPNRQNWAGTKILAAGVTKPLAKGSLNLDASYYDYNARESEGRINLSWSRPLGEDTGLSTQIIASADDKGKGRYSHYVRHETTGEYVRVNSSVGAIYDQSNGASSELSTTLSGNTHFVNGSGSVYLSDSGSKNLSLNLNGGQTLSASGLAATNQRSRAYVKISTDREDSDSDASFTSSVSKEGKYQRRVDVKKDNRLIPLAEYNVAGVNSESYNSSTLVSGGRYNGFIQPGMVVDVDAKILSMETQLLILDDVHGNPIAHLQCIGPGCGVVERVSMDGVFRVSSKKGLDYRLVSQKGICVIENESNNSYRKGYCLPGLEQPTSFDLGELERYVDDDSGVQAFVGVFDKGEARASIVSKLNEINIEFIEVELNEQSYIYIYSDVHLRLSESQYESLKQLEIYVMNLEDMDNFVYLDR